MRTFGCLCYVTNTLPHKDKFDVRAKPSAFLGYPFGQKGYKTFDLKSHVITMSRDVIFHEEISPYARVKSENHTSESLLPIFQPGIYDFTRGLLEG